MWVFEIFKEVSVILEKRREVHQVKKKDGQRILNRWRHMREAKVQNAF